MICSFAQWARDHIHELPKAAEEELEATDFNDYYKIVMSRVQFIFAQATAGADFSSSELTHPLCCFQSQLRRMPTFKKKGVEVKLGLLQGTRQTGTEGCFPSVEEEFRAKLAAVGRRRFTEATLTALLSSHSPRCNKMEEALCPVNASWIKALLGQPLFHLLAEGEPFSESERVEVKVERQPAGQVVLLAQGPWFRVTFVETPLLQFLVRSERKSILCLAHSTHQEASVSPSLKLSLPCLPLLSKPSMTPLSLTFSTTQQPSDAGALRPSRGSGASLT